MEIGQLRAIIVLAEELHFHSAAQRLGITQPALSQKLQRLEGEIGVTLFNRSQRRVSLTEGGHAFLERTRTALSEIENGVRTARKAARGQIGSLHLGFVENASLNVLPGLVSAFRQAAPEVDLRLSEMISADLYHYLQTGRIDVALTRPLSTDFAIDTVLVHREPYLAVLPEGHPLAAFDSVTVAQLARENMIIAAGAKATYLRNQFSPMFARAGFGIRVGQEVNQLPAILGLVSSGIGYALLPDSASKLGTVGVVYRPLAEKDAPHAELVAAWRSDSPSPTVRHFISQLSGDSFS
ncbi:LysR substrate-binding domain-containing protein [Martelella mediterranea]|uniref:LysR substrate-binding domain-containing protein n=1 Tax=uncultured Martelella sp. TaxID=392331 RepID=UPI000D08584E|nr:LysR substrate-binding domain-containing protein [uncultured Martelella sp.]